MLLPICKPRHLNCINRIKFLQAGRCKLMNFDSSMLALQYFVAASAEILYICWIFPFKAKVSSRAECRVFRVKSVSRHFKGGKLHSAEKGRMLEA